MMSAKAIVVLLGAISAVGAFAPKPVFSSTSTIQKAVPDGWVGGFKDSNPDYAYERDLPDLSDLDITGNLENIGKITRMQKVLWPQFSWQSIPGDESSRLYQMFAQDISRIGYDDEGRVWSIICPQRGFGCDLLGTLMLEVTVTGVRGWVDEPNHEIFANMAVEGVVWFENPAEGKNPLLTSLEKAMDGKDLPFSKANGIKVAGHMPGKPYEAFWPMLNGTDPNFFHPQHCKHWDEAYGVCNLQVEMGAYEPTGDQLVDDFNTAILEIFNMVSGNILVEGQRVAWNVWFSEPEVVDTKEWEDHADRWLHSITVEHEYPVEDQGDLAPTYYDKSPFNPVGSIQDKIAILKKFMSLNKDVLLKNPETRDMISLFAEHMFEKKVNHVKDRAKSIVDRIKDRFD